MYRNRWCWWTCDDVTQLHRGWGILQVKHIKFDSMTGRLEINCGRRLLFNKTFVLKPISLFMTPSYCYWLWDSKVQDQIATLMCKVCLHVDVTNLYLD